MGERSHISWTDHTLNLWIGCTRVSPACDGCYAEAWARRHAADVTWGGPSNGAGTRRRTAESTWNAARKYNREAARTGVRPFVFVNSLSDFADNEVPIEWVADGLKLFFDTPNVTYLILSKRPQLYVRRIRQALALAGLTSLPCNVALGTTIEDRERLRINGPALAGAAALLKPAFSFWSCEPLLEYLGTVQLPDWVITGHETNQGGHKARVTPLEAVRSLRDQAAAQGSVFHHKQNGEWRERSQWTTEDLDLNSPVPEQVTIQRVFGGEYELIGKKRSGRLLDGVLHDDRPDDSHLGIWRA